MDKRDVLEREFERLRPGMLRRLASKVPRDLAEDIVGRAALLIFSDPDKWDESRGDAEAFIRSVVESETAHSLSQERISAKRAHERLGMTCPLSGDPGTGDPGFALVEESLSEHPRPGRKHFSGREIEILQLLSTGLEPYEIAEDLGVRPHTVHGHFRNIHRLLGTHSPLQALKALGCLIEFDPETMRPAIL